MLWSDVAQLLDAIGAKGWVSPGKAKAVRTVGVPVLVVAALVWLLVAVLRSGGAAPPQLTAEFVGSSPGSYLDVHLDPSDKSFGSFSARIRGEGRVRPIGQVTATSTSAGGVELHYDGSGYLDPGAPAAGTASSAQSRQRVVRLLLVGQVSPADHTASVDLWVTGRHLSFVSPGQATGAEEVASQFLTAVSVHDWNWVYDLSDRHMRNNRQLADFVTDVGASVAARITEATAVGPMTQSISKTGASFARIPIRVTYGMGNATTAVPAVLTLVLEGGAWRVFSVQ